MNINFVRKEDDVGIGRFVSEVEFMHWGDWSDFILSGQISRFNNEDVLRIRFY